MSSLDMSLPSGGWGEPESQRSLTRVSTHSLDQWVREARRGQNWAVSIRDHEELSFLIPFLRGRAMMMHSGGCASSYDQGSVNRGRRIDVILFATTKDLNRYLKNRTVSSQDLSWPSIDGWTHHSSYRPMNELRSRMSTLYHLTCDTSCLSSSPLTIASTYTAWHESTWSWEALSRYTLTFRCGERYDHNTQLNTLLYELGYTPAREEVSSYGEYEVRTSVCDVFPPGFEHPLRMEFSGTGQLKSIRFFCRNHRHNHSEEFNSVSLLPVSEVIFPQSHRSVYAQALHELFLSEGVDSEERDGILESLHRGEIMTHCDRYAFFLQKILNGSSSYSQSTLFDHMQNTSADLWVWQTSSQEVFREQYLNDHRAAEGAYQWERSQKLPTISPLGYRSNPSDLYERVCGDTVTVQLEADQNNLEVAGRIMIGESISSPHYLQKKQKKSPHQYIDDLISNINLDRDRNNNTVLVAPHRGYFDQVPEQLLADGSPSPKVLDDPFADEVFFAHSDQRGGVYFARSDLSRDYRLAVLGAHSTLSSPLEGGEAHWVPLQWLIEDSSGSSSSQGSQGGIRGGERGSDESQKQWGDYLRSLSDISVGDLVVHRLHGVGKFLGLCHLRVGGGEHSSAECLKIEYSGGDRVYVPVDSMSMLQKHSSAGVVGGDVSYRLDSLSKKGRAGWNKKRAGLQKALAGMATEILRLQSRRQLKSWPAYHSPCEEYHRFIEAFPYIDTPDQESCTRDIEADFNSASPIDRLIIGDVGFGKTEMAMRAAMRSVLQGYQVMVLCPTTVLCYQHTRTFKKRFHGFSVTIASVSRFTSVAELRVIKSQLSSGELSLLIGTHKLLGKGFEPKKLGLVIVDEEQRFGVTHKEKIKALRMEAGVMALSATPIPRTMHMSMVKLRDISLLTTPPLGRLAVKNIHISWSDDIIQKALSQEIQRGGQAFFVHNRVSELESYVSRLKELLPNQDIRMAHGQMVEKDIEGVLIDFIRGAFSVLVCTTIMESGIDMPNVNTILINNASSYGLSQLYQLRGRVGRSGVQAYAYLITPPKTQLSEIARQRMSVMMNHQALGSGFSIASYDMDLRGVGDLLGEQQSGHLASVGVDMYLEMLDRALSEARGEVVREQAPPAQLYLKTEYTIPSSYIKKEAHRLKVYKKVFSFKAPHDLAEYAIEIEEKYGEMPSVTQRMFDVAGLKMYLQKFSARSLVEEPVGVFVMQISQLPQHLLPIIIEEMTVNPDKVSFDSAQRLRLDLRSSLAPSSSDSKHSKPMLALRKYLRLLWQKGEKARLS